MRIQTLKRGFLLPSPPPAQAVRCRVLFKNTDSFLAGVRFYLSYSGSAPTPANCVTLAGDIATQWGTHMSPLQTTEWTEYEVDVLDLSSTSGASGVDTSTHAGTVVGGNAPANVCINIEYDIARRYRGGKPRMFLPGISTAGLVDDGHWSNSTLSSVNSGISAFMAALEALSIGAMGTLQHVNISFFHGHNTSTPPWRGPGYKYPPLYRVTPLIDAVENYSAKAVVGSQKRRRTATTP